MELSVRFMLNEQDKALLEALAKLNGDASMSAILRRLIREEAKRRDVEPIEESNGAASVPVA